MVDTGCTAPRSNMRSRHAGSTETRFRDRRVRSHDVRPSYPSEPQCHTRRSTCFHEDAPPPGRTWKGAEEPSPIFKSLPDHLLMLAPLAFSTAFQQGCQIHQGLASMVGRSSTMGWLTYSSPRRVTMRRTTTMCRALCLLLSRFVLIMSCLSMCAATFSSSHGLGKNKTFDGLNYGSNACVCLDSNPSLQFQRLRFKMS